MPRRRLFGETQKRRKKKSTQALKRQQHVQRVSHTQQPAPFERGTAFDRQDVEFLAAMRDMGVRVQPRRTASPARQEAEQTLHFRHDAAERARLEQAMAELAVRPLASSDPDGAAAPPASQTSGPPAPSRPQAQTQANPQAAPATAAAPPPQDKANADPARVAAPVELTWDEGDAALMAEALADAAQHRDPTAQRERKYDGAPPAEPPRQARRSLVLPDRPDTEVDLHGKTQEEAIHIVQNLLLSSFRQGLRHVLIITGQGHNSGEAGPVLRQAVQHWLERNSTLYAESFSWAPKAHGGAGAIWVVLRAWQQGETP